MAYVPVLSNMVSVFPIFQRRSTTILTISMHCSSIRPITIHCATMMMELVRQQKAQRVLVLTYDSYCEVHCGVRKQEKTLQKHTSQFDFSLFPQYCFKINTI